jgi:hypothetical protein
VQSQLDTFITARYVTIDDLFIRFETRRGPSQPPRLSDAELVCLAVAQVLLSFHSESRWLRSARHRLARLFPSLPQQPASNQACEPRPSRSPTPSVTWPGSPPRGGISSGGSTPPRSL